MDLSMEATMSDTPSLSSNISKAALKRGIEDIFTAFALSAERQAEERFEAFADDPVLTAAAASIRKGDYEGFGYRYLMPFDELTDNLVAKTLAKNRHLTFLFRQQAFLTRYIGNLVREYEGYSCYVDKIRTIMRALMRFYYKGETIRFNYDAEYTYSLPRVVLCNHEDIVEYFEALYDLFYGNPKPYMEVSLKIARSASTPDPELDQESFE